MSRTESDAANVYVAACNREHAECALELLQAFESYGKEVTLSDRSVQLNDVDMICIAEALATTKHTIGVLNIEGNAFGLPGLQALLDAVEKNPGIIRELRLGRNKLKDQAAIVIGHTLSRFGCGLRVLDLSENEITKLGLIPILAALSNESCDIVELSLHNNKIEADAAAYLGQAIRNAVKLRHFHLGYNTIRDTGAAQLAQYIPLTAKLSTLDLTANRIGPDGGKEIAHALMTPSCNIQRLNLRHNLFDNETIEMYADVLRKNTSLIQLFLGFMNPAPESAAVVLSSLAVNRTLLLLDIYGWKLHPGDSCRIIEDIQKTNYTLAAIVTDACQSISRAIDEGNDERDERGQHPIYVGPDDHDAYVATKSFRRFSRAQSRRQSRTSSRAPVSSCGGTPSRRRGNERSVSCKDSETHSRNALRSSQETFGQHQRLDGSGAEEGGRSCRSCVNASGQRDVEVISSHQQQRGSRNFSPDYPSGDALLRMLEQLQRGLAEQKQRQLELEARICALEKRRDYVVGSNQHETVDQTLFERVHTSRSGSKNTKNNFTDCHNKSHDQTHCLSNKGYRASSENGHLRESVSRFVNSNDACDVGPSKVRGILSHGAGRKTFAGSSAGGDGDDVASSVGLRQPSSGATVSGGLAEFPQISSVRTKLSEPPAEPLELPKERKPAEALLQTSTRQTCSYQPQLGPAPSKDSDPPRRKGAVQRA